jgi:diacylglycerol kinase (ATP)
MKSLIRSFRYAIAGFIYCLKNERNMKIHLIVAITVVLISFLLKLSSIEFLIVIWAIAFVWVTEMINTAIEKTIDLYTEDYHSLAKIAKNVAAGSVLVAAINSLFVAWFVFSEKLRILFRLGLFNDTGLLILVISIAALTLLFFIVVVGDKNKKQ